MAGVKEEEFEEGGVYINNQKGREGMVRDWGVEVIGDKWEGK